MPYVFGYGSLVSRVSLEASLGRVLDPGLGPHAARLRDHRRRWNVAAHSSIRPDYLFLREDRSPWEGWIGFLGIEPHAGDTTLGAVCLLGDADLAVLDSRERSYDRVDVTDLVDPIDVRLDSHPVHTYLPSPGTVHDATAGHPVTVMARYLRLVDAAYRSLGDELYAEHVASCPGPAPFVVEEILARPVDEGVVNQAVDPATLTRRRSRR